LIRKFRLIIANAVFQQKPNQIIKFEDFKMLMILGRGAFGKVFLAKLRSNGKLYAVKSIRKDILIEMD
jgi:serine/threonine protein kinase